MVLNKKPGIEISKNAGERTVSVLREGVNDILLATNAAENSILLLTDTYYDGWRAFVDANEAEILKANYAFQAVAVPAGSHQVHFEFVHKRFILGRIVSMISLAVLGLLGAMWMKYRR